MKRLLVAALVLSGCVFGTPGDPDDPDGSQTQNSVNGTTMTNGTPNSDLGEPVDCSDCDGIIGLIRESTGLLPTRTGCPDGTAAVDLGAWIGTDAGIAAVGTRCANLDVIWDTDKFIIRPGNDVTDWNTIGQLPMGFEPKPSQCVDSWLSGLEIRKRGDNTATVRALCGTLSLQFFEGDNGELIHRFQRTGVDPGPTVPAENCRDDNCGNVESIRCEDDGVALGIAGRLDGVSAGDRTILRDFDLVCGTPTFEPAN